MKGTRTPRLPAAPKDPLGPLHVIATLVASLMVTVIGFWALNLLLSGGASTHVGVSCVADVPQTGIKAYGDSAGPVLGDLQPGITAVRGWNVDLCPQHMSRVDRVLVNLPWMLDMAWSIGLVVLILRLVRRARRRGLFTPSTAGDARAFGWYVLLGWLVVNLGGGIMKAVVVSHLVTHYDLFMGSLAFLTQRWSWATIIAGFGVLTVGRVMAQTVPLREEVEATV